MNATKNSIFSQILFVADEFEYMQYVRSATVADMRVLRPTYWCHVVALQTRCEVFASVEFKLTKLG